MTLAVDMHTKEKEQIFLLLLLCNTHN